jgi:1,4-alpha-glucan branching enzyme
MWGHPGKKLLFMGSEIGQWGEWNYDSSLEWHLLQHPEHDGMKQWVQDLNHTYQRESSLHEVDFDYHGFQWIDCCDNENSVISMVRYARDRRDCVVMVFNFTPVPRMAYRIGVPQPGHYAEFLNSDSALYGGSNVGNLGGLETEALPSHGFEQSLSLTVPPLGCVYLKPRGN